MVEHPRIGESETLAKELVLLTQGVVLADQPGVGGLV